MLTLQIEELFLGKLHFVLQFLSLGCTISNCIERVGLNHDPPYSANLTNVRVRDRRRIGEELVDGMREYRKTFISQSRFQHVFSEINAVTAFVVCYYFSSWPNHSVVVILN